jgi:hypothetical protein
MRLWQSKLKKKTMFALSTLSLNPLVWNFRFSKPTIMHQVVEEYFFMGPNPGRARIEICLRPPKWEIFGYILKDFFHLWTFYIRNFFEMKRLTTLSMFWNKLETSVASGADIRVQWIRASKILIFTVRVSNT